MELAHRWSDRNLSRIELTAALLILALLTGGFVERMIRIFAATERRFVETTVINLNSALQVRAAMAAMNGDWAAIRSMLRESPMQAQAPALPQQDPGVQGVYAEAIMEGVFFVPGNYLGELRVADVAGVPGGTWYFDRDDRVLVYRVDNAEFFSGEPVLKYRIAVDYADRDQDGSYEPERDELHGIHLAPAGGGRWLL